MEELKDVIKYFGDRDELHAAARKSKISLGQEYFTWDDIKGPYLVRYRRHEGLDEHRSPKFTFIKVDGDGFPVSELRKLGYKI